MSDDETTINHDSRKGSRDAPIFNDPISADAPRRQLDRKILESYDDTQNRIRNISSRVTRMEAYFETLTKDMRRLEELQKEMAGHLEIMASNSSAAANKLAIHTEMEEYQWQVVNSANETLSKVGAALTEHLQAAGTIATRIDWMERMIWALWGVIGTGAAMLVPLALKGMGVM